MAQPIYQSANGSIKPALEADSNTGLWFGRFYNAFDSNWQVGDDGKGEWIDTVTGLRGNPDGLERAADRLKKLGDSLGAQYDDFKTEWHFATGLGMSHPVENGFTWHHTLGVPYLPASGVKGMLRGWVEVWMEHDESTKRALITRWFGSSAGEEDGSIGNLIFFDALPVGQVMLARDVMTPHMGKWYEAGDSITEQEYANAAPADWHSPVPVPFLVVSNATFRFMIAPRRTGISALDQQAEKDAIEALCQLGEALSYIGAGAKTAAGYGRMRSAKQEQERKSEQARLELEAAGVTMKSTVWNKAAATLNKSTQRFSVATENGESANAAGDFAKQLIQGLSDAAQKRLKDGKRLLLNVTVECKGNSNTIISIQEIN